MPDRSTSSYRLPVIATVPPSRMVLDQIADKW
jgi:hypothetical protein